MQKIHFLPLFVLCLCSFFMPQQTLADTTRPGISLAEDQLKASARTALEKQQYETAYQLNMKLLRSDPDNDETNMALGKAAYETKRYTQALMAYERLSAKYPKDARWALFLARVYVKLGESESARRELALAKQLNPSITDEDIDSAIGSMEKADARFSVHGRVTAGLVYDSNATMGPADEDFEINSWRVKMPGIGSKDSWGTFVSGRLEGGWRTAEDGPIWIMADTAFYKRFNFNRNLPSNQEYGWGRVGLGARYVGTSTLFDLRMKGDIADQSKEVRANNWGPEATFVWLPIPRLQFITTAALDTRSYTNTDRRDGTYWWVGEYIRTIWGEAGHEVTLGIRLLNADTDYDDYAYRGTETSLSARIRLPYSFELKPFVSLRRQFYEGPATMLEKQERTDTLWSYGVSAAYSITEHFQAEVGWRHGSNESESPFYEYDQDVVTFGLTYSF